MSFLSGAHSSNQFTRYIASQTRKVWTDPENPNEWFCIAMEDLCVENDVCNQIVGITYVNNGVVCADVSSFWSGGV